MLTESIFSGIQFLSYLWSQGIPIILKGTLSKGWFRIKGKTNWIFLENETTANDRVFSDLWKYWPLFKSFCLVDP